MFPDTRGPTWDDLWLWLAVLLGMAVIWGLVYSMQDHKDGTPTAPAAEQGARIPTGPRANCRPYVDGPGLVGDVYLCPDGHGWQDIGGATPIPPTPRR